MTGRRMAAVAAAVLLAACGSGEADGPATERPDDGQAVAGTTDAASDSVPASGDDGAAASLTTLRVAGHEVRVEIADDDEERKQGLMHRDSLPADRGMLFVYPEERTLSFWMRNTSIPLDIAYLDRQGTIVDIHSMDPQTDRLYESRQPAMYALELNRGWFEAHGVAVGDRVQF